MDSVDPARRSAIMRSVRQKNTKPEMLLRSALHARGIRYRLHAKELRGQPDLVFRRRRACIFVHGCFWHRHGCVKSTMPKSNSDFWSEKFEANMRRDDRAIWELCDTGWRVLTVWECGLSNAKEAALCAGFVHAWLQGEQGLTEYPFPRRNASETGQSPRGC